ncbi:MAG: DUF6033 family protein, partial [Lachnospiraceae bacterium]|nr:DUF6033 family protein [Lachnospiraceae bacterium]
MNFDIKGYGHMGQNDLIKGLQGLKKPSEPKKTEENSTDAYIQNNYKAENTSSVDNKVELSDGAKKILEELKEKYGNTDFFVADFSNDEEAGRILSNSTKEFGVVIKPEELEKMAESEEYKEKIFNTISDTQDQLNEFKDNLS